MQKHLTAAAKEYLLAWWRMPRVTWWAVVTIAALLALHKPWALTEPQLYAEDGTIFLKGADWYGSKTFLMPYMGYLHLIPRSVAWFATTVLDPLYWPAFYNGTAFIITIAVAARLLSSRFAHLPYRPLMVVAFFIGPHTGEILINITNVQWFTGILLVQQAFIAAPVNRWQRLCDIMIVLVVGLTGPFVAAFLPLVAARWWIWRRADDLIVLLAMGVCTAVQGWFVWHGPQFQHPQFNPLSYLAVICQHLVSWPVLGTAAATKLSAFQNILLAMPVLGMLVWIAVKPGYNRVERLTIFAGFVLILAATSIRGRFDTWSLLTPWDGDRYFHIPRVLLSWLLILQIGSVYFVVRAACGSITLAFCLMHLPSYILPAPPYYKWEDYCESLRKGVAVDIPTLPQGWIVHYDGRRD